MQRLGGIAADYPVDAWREPVKPGLRVVQLAERIAVQRVGRHSLGVERKPGAARFPEHPVESNVREIGVSA